MKVLSVAAAVLSLACLAPRASAEVSGRWHVTGKVSSFAFTLDCDFKPVGARLGGICVDASTNIAKVKAGRSHVVTAGSVSGDMVSWTYSSSFLLSKFDVIYKGVVTGGRMSGSIDAQGRQGTFTAFRR